MRSHAHYIDGEWIEGDETFESRNPATGESLGHFPRGTEARRGGRDGVRKRIVDDD